MTGYSKIGALYLPDDHTLSKLFEFYKESIGEEIAYTLEDIKKDQKLFDKMARNILWFIKQEYQDVILTTRLLLFQALDPEGLSPSTKEMFLIQKNITQLTNRGADENPDILKKPAAKRIKNFFYSMQEEARKIGYMFIPSIMTDSDGKVIREDRINANANTIALSTGLTIQEVLEPGSVAEGHDYGRMLMAVDADALRILVFNLTLTDFDEIRTIPSYFDAHDNEHALYVFAECYGDMPWFLEELSRICGKSVLTEFHLVQPYGEDIKDFVWKIGKGGLAGMGIESMQDLANRMEIYKQIGMLNEQGLKNLKKLLHKESIQEVGAALRDKDVLNEIYKVKDLLAIMPDNLFANLEKIYELSVLQFIDIRQLTRNNSEVKDIVTTYALPLRSLKEYKLVGGYAVRMGIQEENFRYDLCILNNHALDYRIIVQLLQNKVYPTPQIVTLIGSGEKTIEQLIALQDRYKTTNSFDVHNTLHQDLEYFKYSTTSKQMGWDTRETGSYNKYTKRVENLALYGNKNTRDYNEEAIKQAARESLQTQQTIDDLLSQRKQTAIITPNRSYGKVIAGPLGDSIQGYPIQPLKIGSTECHGQDEYAKIDLFTREQVKSLLQKNTDWYVLDGTKGESFPDSNIGFKTYMYAINDAIDACCHEGKETIEIDKRHSSEYVALKEYIVSIIKYNRIDPRRIKKYKMKYLSPNPGIKLKTRGRSAIVLQENELIDPQYNYLFYIDPVIRGTDHQGALDDTEAVSGLTLSYTDTGLSYIYKDLQETLKEEMSSIKLDDTKYHMYEENISLE